MNITSAETLLRMANTSNSAYSSAILAREALRVAQRCHAARGPIVAKQAAEMALERATAISTTAPEFDREIGRDVALEARRFLQQIKTREKK